MKHIFFIIFINVLTASVMNAQEKLIYVGDPMCSWCYGFGPQLEKVVEKYKKHMEIEIVTGGLRPYFDKPISEMKDFLSTHWKDVNSASQQPFNYDILDRADLNYDTEPACRAVVVVRHMNPDKELAFFKMIQTAFYYLNMDLGDVESYHAILEELGLDKEEFSNGFHSKKFKELVKEDFQRARELGVRSFPTLLLQSGNNTIVLAQGYLSAESVSEAILRARKH